MDKIVTPKPIIAAIPGSFDPFTIGHLDIVKRAAQIFEMVYVAVMNNQDKKYFFSLSQRLELAKDALANLENVICQADDGMFYEYAKKRNVSVIVKGVRTFEDFQYEKEMAKFNKDAYPFAETMILFASDGLDAVSSSTVKAKALRGENVSFWVGDKCNDLIFNKLNNKGEIL